MSNTNKAKKLWWLWVLLGLVVVTGVVAAILAFASKSQADKPEYKLYWNVERSNYVALGMSGTTSRMPSSDGYYYMKMAVDGQQERYKVEDYTLVNQMEFMELMCLEFDENGVVVAALTPEEAGYRIVADKYVVESVTDTQIVCNTSVKYKGMQVTYELGEDTAVYQIADFEAMMGVPGAVNVGDQVIVLEDSAGNVDTVYTFPYVPPGDVYWNINRMWDATLRMTSREPDMYGYYSYDFAVNGEIVTLKTQKKAIADLIDKHASRSMGLTLDENGNIDQILNAGNAVCGGGLLCNNYKVTNINDGEVTFKLGGNAYTEVLSKDCKFFDVSGAGSYIGEPVDGVILGDTVTVLKDRRDQVCLIFISGRMTDADVFWNVDRNKVWNRSTWTTDRERSADGYYYIKLAGNGEQITVKTRDYDIANTVDSNVCWAVELNGDEIVRAVAAANRYGGGMFAPYYVVTSLENGKISAVNSSGTTKTAKLSETCEVYDVSSGASFVGIESEVRVGDTIYGLTDLDGTVQYLFVTSRPKSGYIYWNVNRQYDSVAKVTTRVPDANGYYHFEFVVNGQTQWLKTKDKNIATSIDLVVTRARGLVVTGDIIRAVVAPNSLEGYKGVKPDVSWATVKSINGDKAVVVKNGKEQTVIFSQWCKFYNVTNAYNDHRGEDTDLRVGDVIVTLKNEYGKAVVTYICGGRSASFNTKPTACVCGDGKWTAWDGTTPLTTGHYYLTQDITAPAGGWTLKNGTTYLRLDGHTISSDGRIFTIGDNANLYLCGHNGGGTISGGSGDTKSGAVIQGSSTNGRIYAYNVDLCNNGTGAAICENGGVISVSCFAELHNVNIYGGSVSRKGGNLAVMPTGNLEMYGCTVSGGVAKLDGGNVLVTGNAYFEDVTIVDGICPSGGNVSITAANKTAIINGCNIRSSASDGQGLFLVSGTLELQGNIQITDHKDYDLMLAGGAMLDITDMSSSSKVGISMASPGVFAENTNEQMKDCFESNDKALGLVYENGSLSIASNHSHCVCGGALAGHSCSDTGFAALTQEMFDSATANSVPVRVSGTTYRLSGGAYYLEEDITFGGQLIVSEAASLCLNGKTITSSASRVLVVAGNTVSIGDCVGSGKVQGYKAATAANILIQGSNGASGTKGTLNIFSGNIIGGQTTNSSSGQAANIHVYNGTLNVYGGTITGGKALGQGGNILVAANQTMNIYGGTFIDGTASAGNGIYVVAGAKVTLDGKASIESIYLSGASLTIKHMDTAKVINLESSKTGVFAENVTTDYSGCFAMSGKEVVYNSNAKTLSVVNAAPPVLAHNHCLCNGSFTGHSCATVTWEPLTAADLKNGNYKTDGSVYYYLTEDVVLTASVTLAKKTLHLCLNGKTITAPSAARCFVLSGGTLDLTDCKTTGKLVGGKGKNGGCILVQGSSGGANGTLSALNLYGGTVVGGEATSTHGGSICVAGGTMNMYGGKVEGGKAKNFGGAIFVDQKQYLNLYGGIVTSGTAGTKGKCVMGGANAKITVGGSVKLEELYVVSVNKISVSADVPLTKQASIVVYMDAPGLLAENVLVDCAEAFTAAGYIVAWDENTKTLTLS